MTVSINLIGDSIHGALKRAKEASSAADTGAKIVARQVENVARMSEDNSVSAEKTAALSKDLDVLAASLREVANRFRV